MRRSAYLATVGRRRNQRGYARKATLADQKVTTRDGVDHGTICRPEVVEDLVFGDAIDALEFFSAGPFVVGLRDVLEAFFDRTPSHRLPAAQAIHCAIAVVGTARGTLTKLLRHPFHLLPRWAELDGVLRGLKEGDVGDVPGPN